MIAARRTKKAVMTTARRADIQLESSSAIHPRQPGALLSPRSATHMASTAPSPRASRPGRVICAS